MPARKEETVRAVEDAAAVSLPIDGAVGLGVDIVEIARMKKILERTPSFARKVFSCEECCYCEDTAMPEVHFCHALRCEGGRGEGSWNGLHSRNRSARYRGEALVEGAAVCGAVGPREAGSQRAGRSRASHLAFVYAYRCRRVCIGHHGGFPEGGGGAGRSESRAAKRFKEARSMLDEIDAPADATSSGEKAASPEGV